MDAGELNRARAALKAGRLLDADALADGAIDQAAMQGDGETLLAWIPLSSELCDRLGRPVRAVHVLSLGAAQLRRDGDGPGATALEVEDALRCAAARLEDWESRLGQAYARVVDEGARDWSLGSVQGLYEACRTLDQGAWIARGALRVGQGWAEEGRLVDAARLVAFSAEELEAAREDSAAEPAWALACRLGARVALEEQQEWVLRRQRCAARLLSRG